jgi:hypothetical protein
MKAKKVYEFEQGGNPYDTMGLGYSKTIKDWFTRWTLPSTKYVINNNQVYSEGGYSIDINPDVPYLPDNWIVTGSLLISHFDELMALPKKLKIEGDLVMLWTEISELPSDLIVLGAVYIDESNRDMLRNKPKGIKHIWIVDDIPY